MPISEKQRKILAFPYTKKYQGIICDGAVRSGKTSCMTIAFIDWAMYSFNGYNFAICGKTVLSAIRNIINPYLSLTYHRDKYSLKFTRSESKLVVSQGERTNTFYVFGGRDESSHTLIQGITLAGVLLDEVALMPQSFVDQAIARCSVGGSLFWFSCNPQGPAHWFHEEWIQKHREKRLFYLHFTLDDNPSLSEEIKQRYHSLYSGVFYERYVLGKWAVAHGLVYSQFSKDVHTYSGEIPLLSDWAISVDYGTYNPFSAGLWNYNQDMFYRVSETYYSGREKGFLKTDKEYCDMIDELASKMPDTAECKPQVIVDPSAASFIECLKRRGYPVYGAKNDVMNGIQLVSRYLSQGKIKLHESCTDSIREFALYRWDTSSTIDKPLKTNDHAMDDIRYCLYTLVNQNSGWGFGSEVFKF